MNLAPFFTFYGGKYRAARRYPPPTYDTIIEPFAGSAGYALRHPHLQVVLVERDPAIAETWRYLLQATAEEVLRLPDLREGQTTADLDLKVGARHLVGWWVNKGSAVPKRSMSANMRSALVPHRGGNQPTGWWGPAIRARIAAQLGAIRHWTLIEGDYTAAPDVEATWFVDAPYQLAGQHYRHGARQLDYAALGRWCRARRGQVVVCENVGADWLPFRPFIDIKASEARHGGKVSREAIYELPEATG